MYLKRFLSGGTAKLCLIGVVVLLSVLMIYLYLSGNSQIESFKVDWIETDVDRVVVPRPAYDNVDILYNKTPFIYRLNNFLTPAESRHIIEKCGDRFKRSNVTSNEQDKSVNEVRTSHSCELQVAETDIIKAIEEKASLVTGLPIENIEPLQVVRYTVGQKYDAHNDWFHNENEKQDNQRYVTILVYLNDDFEGGATDFVHPDVKIKAIPRVGDAIMWYNCWNPDPTDLSAKNYKCFDQAKHQGSPPSRGVKYALNIWTRLKKYRI